MELSYYAGVNLEDISDTVQDYWYEYIWFDKYDKDDSITNLGVLKALGAKSDEIDDAEDYDAKMEQYYLELKNIPEAISNDDLYEVKNIRDAVIDLYDVYVTFYDLATDPSGSYDSYSVANNKTTDQFIGCYEELNDLLK